MHRLVCCRAIPQKIDRHAQEVVEQIEPFESPLPGPAYTVRLGQETRMLTNDAML